MYTANSAILYSKEKTVRILGTWHQYLANVSGLRYSKQIEFLCVSRFDVYNRNHN